MLQETETDEAHDIPPVVVASVRDLFLQHRTDRNHGGERISENQKLQKEIAAKDTESRGGDHRDVANQFEYRGTQLEDPLVGQCDGTHAAVLSREQHVAIGPENVEQALLPAGSLTGQRTQVRGNFGPAG